MTPQEKERVVTIIMNLVECLQGWMKIAEEEDQRQYDTDAVIEAKEFLEALK